MRTAERPESYRYFLKLVPTEYYSAWGAPAVDLLMFFLFYIGSSLSAVAWQLLNWYVYV